MEGPPGGVPEGDRALIWRRVTSRTGYGLAALVTLAVEMVIAVFVDDAFVRPYVGDALAVVLVYLGVRWLTLIGPRLATGTAFALAVAIEVAQYFHLLAALGWESSHLARTLFGGVFDPKDLAAYSVGAAAVLLVERWRGAPVRLATPPPAGRR